MDYRQKIIDLGFDRNYHRYDFDDYVKGDEIKKYKLLLKTHYETGIHYLCITKRDNYEKYTGSGKRWKILLNKHPSRVLTTLLYTTNSTEDLEIACAYHSLFFNIPENPEFANLVPELGYEENQGNLSSWVKSASAEKLKETRLKQSASLKAAISIKKENGIKFGFELAEHNLFQKTGMKNYMQYPEIAKKVQESSKKTLLAKYGVDNNMKIPWVLEKSIVARKAAMLKKYGVENIMELPEFHIPAREKAKETMLARYGVENVSQIPGKGEKTGKAISKTLQNRPYIKCSHCEKTSKSIKSHEKHCKFNPNREYMKMISCEYCEIKTISSNISRWHNKNCKHNPNKGNKNGKE